MKVLLIRPQAPNKLSFTKILDNEPLELEYLHTALASCGIDDYIYDGLIEHDIRGAMVREQPDVVAVTGYITQQNLMIEYCRLARELFPQVVTVVGGVHAQLNYKSFYEQGIDYVYRSECVRDFARLVSLHDGNKTADQVKTDDLKTINGLCFYRDGAYEENPLIPIDIDSLPIPDRSFFDQNKAHYRYLNLTEVATIKTAFSCPYSCNFCYCTLLNGGKYRARDIDLVVEELEEISAENIQIVDDDFLVDPKRLTRFIQLVKEKGIRKRYICYARADFVCAHPELVQELADIGFYYFLVGLEAISDQELLNFHKGTSVDMNERCVKMINDTGAHCIALMIAPIDADQEYFDNLYAWVLKTDVKYVTVSIFTPIPGTPLYEEYKDRITSTDIGDWDFLHLVLEPEKLTRKQFYYEYNRLFMRLYQVAKKTGIYGFMDLKYYKNMLSEYLRRKIKGE